MPIFEWALPRAAPGQQDVTEANRNARGAFDWVLTDPASPPTGYVSALRLAGSVASNTGVVAGHAALIAFGSLISGAPETEARRDAFASFPTPAYAERVYPLIMNARLFLTRDRLIPLFLF